LTQEGPAPEVIVSDDSPDDDIAEMVSGWTKIYSNLRYQRGPRSGNAADNWNAAISSATRDYVVLVHHDEFFARSDYLIAIGNQVTVRPGTCTLAGTTVVGTLRPSRFHTVTKLAARIGRPPWTLYASNWIGPTAALAFPRDVGVSFDRNLLSLVDVDFYARVLSRAELTSLDNVFVYSGAHVDQITAQHDLTALNRKEIRYIEARNIAASTLQRRVIQSTLWLRDKISGIRPVSPRKGPV
jgi:glycosyltransferase involved in cell wall biosynthesis